MESDAKSMPSTAWILDDVAIWWLVFAIVIVSAVVLFWVYRSRSRGAAPINYDDDERKVFASTRKIVGTLAGFIVLGIIAIIVACAGLSNGKSTVNLGVGLLTAAAAGGVGGVMGFIFGIPRTLTGRAAAPGSHPETSLELTRTGLAANTNLERISDWLATLLIGATLVQLGSIPSWIHSVSTAISAADQQNTSMIALSIVYFFALGFLGVYLITRLYLTTALASPLRQLVGVEGISIREVIDARLKVALVSGESQSLRDALRFAEFSGISGPQAADPSLNANLARALALYLKNGNVDDPTARDLELKAAVRNAANDAAVKVRLKTELATKQIETGDSTRDAELIKILT